MTVTKSFQTPQVTNATEGSVPNVAGSLVYNTDGDLLEYKNNAGSYKIIATTAGTITNATNIGITDDTSTNAIVYPTWVTSNTGFLPAKVSSNALKYNPSIGTLYFNNYSAGYFTTVSSGTPIVLTNASTRIQSITGSSAQTVQLPNATTLSIGWTFEINNNSTGSVTVNNAGGSTQLTIPSGGYARINCIAVSTSNGAWDWHFLMPANASYGTSGIAVTGTIQATSQILSTKTGSATSISGASVLLKGTTPSFGAWDTNSGSLGLIVNQNDVYTNFYSAPYAGGAGNLWLRYSADLGQIDILANSNGSGAGGIVSLYGGQGGNSGTGGHIQLIAGSSGTGGSVAGSVYIRGGIASAGVNGNVYVDQGYFIVSNLPTSNLVSTGTNSELLGTTLGTHLSLTTGTLSTDATNANTASTIVARDASGNFSAGTVTAALTGTATNATNTAITDDTSTNATMYPTWVTANTGNLPQKTTSTKLTFNPSTGLLSTTGLNLSGLTASQAVVTDSSKNLVSLAYTSNPTASTLVSRDASGNTIVNRLNVNSATSAVCLVQSQTTGTSNSASYYLNRADLANGVNAIILQTAGSNAWQLGTFTASETFHFRDTTNSVDSLTISQGSGTTSVATFSGSIHTGVAIAPVYGGTGLDSSAWSQGDLVYISATGVWNHLAKSSTASRYLANSGSSNNPAWDQIDMTNGVKSQALSTTFTIGDGTNNFTTSFNTCHYYQLGSLILLSGIIIWTDKGSATAGLGVQVSLPFTIGGNQNRVSPAIGYANGISFTGSYLIGTGSNGNAYFQLIGGSNAGAMNTVAVSQCAAAGTLEFSVFYWTN